MEADEIKTARRRLILDISRRRQRPGSGSQPWDRSEQYRLNWPDLTSVLAGIPWAVVGAVATRRYMPERATADLDVAILGADAQRVSERLESAGFRLVGRLSIGGSTWRSPSGVSLDIIEGEEGWWPRALVEASQNIGRDGQPTLPLAFLVLMKTLAGRSQDVADVVRMLGNATDAELEQVRSVVREVAADLVADIESMVVQGKLETGR